MYQSIKINEIKNEINKINTNHLYYKTDPDEYTSAFNKKELIYQIDSIFNQLHEYHLFVTLDLSVNCPDYIAWKANSQLLKFVQSKIYRSSSIKKDNCFHGISVGERHVVSGKEGMLHFHNIIEVNYEEIKPQFLNCLESIFHKSAYRLYTYIGCERVKIAAKKDSVHYIETFDEVRLASYNSKDLRRKIRRGETEFAFINVDGCNDPNTLF